MKLPQQMAGSWLRQQAAGLRRQAAKNDQAYPGGGTLQRAARYAAHHYKLAALQLETAAERAELDESVLDSIQEDSCAS